MTVIRTSIPEILIFEPQVFGDARGYFLESFRQDFIKEHIGDVQFVQDNESYSQRGVLRGLHFQRPPFTQAKLVRVIHGEVLDIAVDIRIGSPTFGQYESVILSGENKRQFYVPRGFAHGFVVLSETALFSYKCDNYYAPAYDGGMQWNDPKIGIDWRLPVEQLLLSEKDKTHPSIDAITDFKYGEF